MITCNDWFHRLTVTYTCGCHLSSYHIGLSLSNVYVAAIVTSENYLDNSIRNITNKKEGWPALSKSLQCLITLKCQITLLGNTEQNVNIAQLL